jgi:hypothetical protein
MWLLAATEGGGTSAEHPHSKELLLCHTHIARTGGTVLATWLQKELALHRAMKIEECAAQTRGRCRGLM